MQFKRFPDFDKDVQRPFPVHEYCYDCAEFYDGCNAWPANRPFDCADFNRLPDTTPGGGQLFAPSRMQGRKEPNARGAPIADSQGNFPAPAPVSAGKKPAVSRASPRLCECGTVLLKGKQLCESCRVQRRRQTMRKYMRGHRAASRKSEPVDDMPLLNAARPPRDARSDDLPVTILPSGGADSKETSV